MPNVCVVRQHLFFTFDIVVSCFFSAYLIRQLKACSSLILLATAYSANSTRLETFKSFNGTHVDDPSFHSTSNNHPGVVRLGDRLPFLDV